MRRKTLYIAIIMIAAIMRCAVAETNMPAFQAPDRETLTSVYDANGREGLVNASGQIVFPYSQDGYYAETIQPSIISALHWEDGVERCALYNYTSGVKTDFIYRQAYGGNSGDSLILVLSIDGLFGYINQDFDVVIPCRFFDAQPFACGPAWAQETDGRKGFIDENGDMIIPSSMEWTDAERFSEDLAAVCSAHTGLSGYIDRLGHVVIPLIYQDAKDFSEGKAAVTDDQGSLYIQKDGHRLNDTHWDDAESFRNGFAVVYRNGLVGYIGDNGAFALPCNYKKALPANDDRTAWVSQDGLAYCLVDLTNQAVLSEPYLPAYEDDFFPHVIYQDEYYQERL